MSKYNTLLVEFDFLVDIDLAIWRYLKEKYSKSKYIDRDIIDMNDEQLVAKILLARHQSNVLEILMPKYDTINLFKELTNDNEEELLKYATVYDTFGLMVTYLNAESKAIDVNILCRNKIESDYIISLNPIFKDKTIIGSRFKQDLSKYTVIYVKHFAYCLEYMTTEMLHGKNIYISYAGFNMEPDKPCANIALTKLFSDTNRILTIDMYKDIKYTIDNDSNYNNTEEE